MSTLQKIPKHQETVINAYLPAVLKENKSGWIIEYYATHPITLILTRKQIRLQRIVSRYKSVKEARMHVYRMIVVINAKLAGGWNPFFEEEDSRMYEKLSDVLTLFLNEKRKELRENTMRSYDSFKTILTEWTNKNNPDLYASLFNQNYAVRYMDYVYNTRNVGVTTYNNHIKMGRAVFNWLKERCYTKQNPFELIKPKPKQKKTRIIIPTDVRTKITEHLKACESPFLIICKLIYTSLLRPNEIKLLRVRDVNIVGKYIRVPGEVAKNHKTRYAALSNELIKDFAAMNLDRYPTDYYLFGSY